MRHLTAISMVPGVRDVHADTDDGFILAIEVCCLGIFALCKSTGSDTELLRLTCPLASVHCLPLSLGV
jgi:hypothetical protein